MTLYFSHSISFIRTRPIHPTSFKLNPFSLSRNLTTTTTTTKTKIPTTHLARSYRFAICGAGPAGFYSASRLLSLLNDHQDIRIDLFDKLPTPFGLSRYGVAPDHPEVKNCEHKFEEVAQDPRVKFFGNTRLTGEKEERISFNTEATITISELRSYYDAVILSYGSCLDRDLGGIPGETNLSNIIPARSVVNWYNSYPRSSSNDPINSFDIDLSKIEKVVILGQGNVALDIARILLTDIDQLAKTDISERALENLSNSQIKEVEIVGRRGPLQMPCTTKELRELLSLKDVRFETDLEILNESIELIRQPEILNHLQNSRLRKRLIELMSKSMTNQRNQTSSHRSWSFRFLRSPIAFHPDPNFTSTERQPVKKIEWQRNRLLNPKPTEIKPHMDLSTATAIPSEPSHTFTSQADLVIKSIGYRPEVISGIPYNSRQTSVNNIDGRVINEKGEVIPGLYVSGWLSRGANGVIANTMYDAFLTIDKLIEDIQNNQLDKHNVSNDLKINGKENVMDWNQWKIIDEVEKINGIQKGKVREKIEDLDRMMEIGCKKI
ncbi:uncharacterized protein MELLADRAFT_49489 [Melampsora larici-populina 98AG31]|uniref:NADPH:adrenodoxin oxidoreductase, mitochondrial n=1 Tax=Melampsora larici-populina (strain 98AG31 / pathotype 3-4-7) TaxID=747676 RepID=F4RVQ4_MELLP|nr:uncharacterized protein MELLADRAFT_49489 [Melampsora larici-populina 98AG31]EGG03543.1 hypothetical protein MELLADRAFT_49489 [Melampsora larici-populina 98AG31]